MMLIGEVSRLSGVSVRMLRHYDEHGLVSPSNRTSGGYRDYDRGDVHRLMKAEALRALGMGVAEVRTALDDPGLDVGAVLDRLRAETRDRIRAEQALLDHLDTVRGRPGTTPGTWDDVLGLTSLLTALRSDDPARRQSAALTASDRPTAGALVELYLEEDDPNVAGALRWSLVRTAGDAAGDVAGDVTAELSGHLPHADPAVRLRVVEVLREINDARATTILTDLLDDPPPVRGACALALARRTDSPALVGTLVEMVLTGDHDVEAAEALAVMRTRRSTSYDDIPATLVAAVSGASPDARLRVVQALAEITPDSPDVLAAFTDDADPRVARTARALSRR